MNTKTTVTLHVIVLLFVAGAAYAIGRITAPTVMAPAQTTTASTSTFTPTAEDTLALSVARSEIEALKAEKQRLQEALEQGAPITEEAAEEVAEVAPPEHERPRSWREHMEELREQDPERYQKEMERRENFMKMIQQNREARASFLDSIDLSLLTPEAQENHLRFSTALARQGELQAQLMAAMESGEMPDEELRQEMHSVFREIMDTRDAERDALLDAIATTMGLEGDGIAEFTALVNEVFSATSGNMMRMPPRGRGAPPEMPPR